ncbi:MAG: type II toxin-antitoxin system Phd/YefM family antitoxin [Vulcanimicrobiaceae bacterium]
MKTVNMHDAKTNLSRLVQAVRDGAESEIVIAVGGVPAARLVSYAGPRPRLLGIDRGLVTIADDFDAPNAAIATLFERS